MQALLRAEIDTQAMHIGERLRTLVKERGVAVKALALHCGVTTGAVSNWFRTGRITKENLLAAAEFLGTTADEVISGAALDRSAPQAMASPASALNLLARALAGLPRLERLQLATLLPLLATEPETSRQTMQAILRLLGADPVAADEVARVDFSELALDLAEKLDAIPEGRRVRAHRAASVALSLQEFPDSGDATGDRPPPPGPRPGSGSRKPR
jgi:transcriptional regulator with XRE-family HTH domain